MLLFNRSTPIIYSRLSCKKFTQESVPSALQFELNMQKMSNISRTLFYLLKLKLIRNNFNHDFFFLSLTDRQTDSHKDSNLNTVNWLTNQKHRLSRFKSNDRLAWMLSFVNLLYLFPTEFSFTTERECNNTRHTKERQKSWAFVSG